MFASIALAQRIDKDRALDLASMPTVPAFVLAQASR